MSKIVQIEDSVLYKYPESIKSSILGEIRS